MQSERPSDRKIKGIEIHLDQPLHSRSLFQQSPGVSLALLGFLRFCAQGSLLAGLRGTVLGTGPQVVCVRQAPHLPYCLSSL